MTLIESVQCLLVTLALSALLLTCSWLTRRWRWLLWPFAAVPVALGVLFAFTALATTSAYAASVSFGGAWFVALGFLLAGGLLVLFRRVRRSGVAGLLAGAAVLLVFYAVYLTGYGLGLHRWKKKTQMSAAPIVDSLGVADSTRKQR